MRLFAYILVPSMLVLACGSDVSDSTQDTGQNPDNTAPSGAPATNNASDTPGLAGAVNSPAASSMGNSASSNTGSGGQWGDPTVTPEPGTIVDPTNADAGTYPTTDPDPGTNVDPGTDPTDASTDPSVDPTADTDAGAVDPTEADPVVDLPGNSDKGKGKGLDNSKGKNDPKVKDDPKTHKLN